MNRRGFILGTLATSGLAFFAKPLTCEPIKCLDVVSQAERRIRLFSLEEQQLKLCKILYVSPDGVGYVMPGIKETKVSRKYGTIDFTCHDLKVTTTASFTGLVLVDDRTQRTSLVPTWFDQTVHMNPGDTLKVTYRICL